MKLLALAILLAGCPADRPWNGTTGQVAKDWSDYYGRPDAAVADPGCRAADGGQCFNAAGRL